MVICLLLIFLCIRNLKPGTAEAEETARALLVSMLSPRQAADFSRNGYFTVVSREKIGRIYRITPGRRPEVYEGRKCVSELCIYDEGKKLPPSDLALAHKLKLETAETEYLQIAVAYPR